MGVGLDGELAEKRTKGDSYKERRKSPVLTPIAPVFGKDSQDGWSK
ncbi:MAG: hypothetical protein GX047_04035 [Firmicutes bacterium]|jgi:hypothetical protein|nr:hypothetical protein [Bacillota bacterium]